MPQKDDVIHLMNSLATVRQLFPPDSQAIDHSNSQWRNTPYPLPIGPALTQAEGILYQVVAVALGHPPGTHPFLVYASLTQSPPHAVFPPNSGIDSVAYDIAKTLKTCAETYSGAMLARHLLPQDYTHATSRYQDAVSGALQTCFAATKQLMSQEFLAQRHPGESTPRDLALSSYAATISTATQRVEEHLYQVLRQKRVHRR